MKIQKFIALIDKEWDEEAGGFLGNLRYGRFDPKGLERLIDILESISVEEMECLDRRFVSLIWFIPIFIEWQISRLKELGDDTQDLQTASDRIMPLLYKILGIP